MYIFDDESSIVQKLVHGSAGKTAVKINHLFADGQEGETVQTLAASKSSTQWVLVTTTMEGNGMIRVWTKDRKKVSTTWEVIRFLFLVLVAIILLPGVLKVSEIVEVSQQHLTNFRHSPRSCQQVQCN